MISLSGVALILVVMAVPFLAREIRGDSKIASTVFVILLTKQVVTFLHIYIGPLPTVYGDPISFNRYAMGELGYEALGGNLSLQHLKAVYDAFGGSHLLGCEIAQLGYSVALVFFVKLTLHLGHRKTSSKLLLIFAMIPSSLLNTSVVLREGWQMAGFLGLAFALVTLRNTLVSSSVLLIVSSAVLVYFHNGLGAYVCLAVPIGLVLSVSSRPGLFVVLLSAALALLPLAGRALLKNVGQHSVVVSKFVEGDGNEAMEYIGNYQKGVSEARSAFPVTLDLSSGSTFATTGSIVVAYYLFSPFPWEARSVLDIVGLAEACLRIVLFACALGALRRARGSEFQDSALLWALFLLLELVWAAGTANTGTAVRHRLVAWGVLVVLGGPSLLGDRRSLDERTGSGEAQVNLKGLRQKLRAQRQ